ncbi:lateral flagellar FliI-like assembly ATPase LfiI [Aeromonas caviae]|uniref:Flagellum-specific ATP synthase n=1 Tax=Aeromonas caviae TaxID=648 RepID=A0AA42UDC0_AERCA|nr:lateral flagellar FliI-like assembly ATPase LfiI [Aeromonas caviae]MBL0584316.1 lateral flagellar FliI-like assembly ATPase LfiI [Aeromonas caviae]MDH0432125.1 lateral flagellar FliI-like assembly ATPase LfiI [Aeromonas caviae]MDH0934974.1 lateral flagellar FliI-like assembly ATPase LfiI [Aeromonas caviae]MDH1395777.1 lateral flagellar FliI-like assembly ATPase LfiI [Aeromonas caviae]MDH1504598.1 lateral flagellar FliI-like assembly ATPase LfiI [Aeromonas caviae]
MHDALQQALTCALDSLEEVPGYRRYGRLVRVTGLTLEVVGCQLIMGQRCEVETATGAALLAEVVGFNRDISYLMPLQPMSGLYAGARVLPVYGEETIRVGEHLLGRVVDGLLQPLDGRPLKEEGERVPLFSSPPNPLLRTPVREPLDVGIRAINGLLTVGKGQRLGLFAGSGVGKSMLLGMMTRNTSARIVVVGLIGERGREVREFIEHSLGSEGLARAVVIAAPADQSPLMRLRAAQLCHRIAEYFREQGQDVLLLMDSLTRYAQAQREIALAIGEPPATRGYPPSVFSLLTQLVERAGNGTHPEGSLSAFYTVLAEGDDQQDPVVDSARAILDGHIVLTRRLAEEGHYPAIDIGASVSRVMPQVVSPEWQGLAVNLRQLWGRYQQVRELLPLGGYQPGADPQMDEAVQRYPAIASFLQQGIQEETPITQVLGGLKHVLGRA